MVTYTFLKIYVLYLSVWQFGRGINYKVYSVFEYKRQALVMVNHIRTKSIIYHVMTVNFASQIFQNKIKAWVVCLG